RCAVSNSAMLPSTLPAASRLSGDDEKDSVSTPSDCACSDARIWPADAAGWRLPLPPLADFFIWSAGWGRPTTLMCPSAPPTSTSVDEHATLYSPPSTSNRWSAAVMDTTAWPVENTSQTYRLPSSETVARRLPSGVHAPAVQDAVCR